MNSVNEYFKVIKETWLATIFGWYTFESKRLSRKHPTGTHRPRDVPWRSPKGPNVRDLPWTFRGLSEDQYKNWWFMRKLFFKGNILSITYLFLLYTEVLNGDVHDTSTELSSGTSMGTNNETSRDVLETSVKHVFQIKLTSTLNLLWQVTQDFIANGSRDKFNEQYSGKTII